MRKTPTKFVIVNGRARPVRPNTRKWTDKAKVKLGYTCGHHAVGMR